MKKLLLFLILSAATLHAQNRGAFEGYDGELAKVSQQLISLAEATPSAKFSWRPAPGVRSVSEAYMHIAIDNFGLLSEAGAKEPATPDNLEKTVTSKAEVIDWLKRSLEAVKTARAQLKPGDLQHKVKIDDKTVTVDGIYLRILIHNNEHMGQEIAYARMNGVVPLWSK